MTHWRKIAFLLISLLLIPSVLRVATAPVKNKIAPGAVLGIGILKRIPGLWYGPVSSSTPAGSFTAWHVDFRPVSPGQISQYSTLDEDTLNYISFFIVAHDKKLKVAMRTEGVFQNKGCVTYEVIDTVREPEGFYKFSDFRAGDRRAYTVFNFREDKLVMEVYTSKFNKVHPPRLHSRWTARLGDRTAVAENISHFKFPQPVMVKDFSNVFNNMPESIYYTFENDPYPSSSQPHMGSVTVNISISKDLKTGSNHELFILLTTESLFEGIKYRKENLKYVSRYAYLPINKKSYTFKNVHPGKYYLYSYEDVNGDKKHTSGDYMSSNTNNVFRLRPNGSVAVDTRIDFLIP